MIPYCTIWYHIVQYDTILYNMIPYCTILVGRLGGWSGVYLYSWARRAGVLGCSLGAPWGLLGWPKYQKGCYFIGFRGVAKTTMHATAGRASKMK